MSGCRSYFSLLLLLGLLLPAVSLAQTRKPVPAAADVQAATQLIAEVYKKDYAAAKTASEKQTLARKLLSDAAKSSDDLASAFALCKVAQKMAVANGDVDAAMQAVQLLTERFEMDAGELQRDVFNDVAPQAKTPADQLALSRYIGRALPAILKAEDFTTAQELAALAVTAAKKSKDADAQKTWSWRQQRLIAQAKAAAEVPSALATLKSSPADAAANGIAGKYVCFWKEDWQQGMPLLALSAEETWQPLAERELKGATSAAEQLALADAWYEAAIKAETPAKEAVLRRVAAQYERLLAKQSPLIQRRIEMRLAEIGEITSPFPKDHWIEVLDLVDVEKHADEQKWTREGLAVSQRDPRHGKGIIIPMIAEGSYEMRIVAERPEGPEVLFVNLSRSLNGAGFALNCYGGRHSGIHLLNGRAANDNASRTAPAKIPEGQPYVLHFDVQRKEDQAGLLVQLNQRPYFRWVGTQDKLSIGPIKREEKIKLSVVHSSIVIYSVQFKRKSGAAWLTDQSVPRSR